MLSPELFFCVSVELFSRAVASQVFSPLQRLTSVFGMGTGGPTALKTLTHWYCVLLFGLYTNFTIGSELWTFLFTTPSGQTGLWPAGAPPGTRTPDPLIKSQLLYQLS